MPTHCTCLLGREVEAEVLLQAGLQAVGLHHFHLSLQSHRQVAEVVVASCPDLAVDWIQRFQHQGSPRLQRLQQLHHLVPGFQGSLEH